MECQEGAEGLEEVGEVDKKGRRGPQSGDDGLQGGDICSTPIWLRDLGNFHGDGEHCEGDAHQFSKTNHGKVGIVEVKWDVGDSQGESSVGSGGNPVENELHWKKTGGGGIVGGALANFRGMHKEYGI